MPSNYNRADNLPESPVCSPTMEGCISVLTRVISYSFTQINSDLSRHKVQKFHLYQAACLKIKEMRRNHECLV